MINPSVQQITGLRERKKARTRRMLIDAAVDLCLRQGYENTTVEQISDAADVSPRTFSRYFASKDAVFIAVLDDLAGEIVTELMAHPSKLGPMEELRAAHMAVLGRVSQRPPVGLTVDRVARMLRVVYSSPTLRQAAIEYRSMAAMEALADHMGVPVCDRSVELAVALFATTIVTACTDVTACASALPQGPNVIMEIMERLEESLGEVAHFAAKLRLR